jgi:hypothetical protein
MPKINLKKQFGNSIKSTVTEAKGLLNGSINEAGGKGAFAVGFGKNGLSISANFNNLLQKEVEQSEADGPLRELYEKERALDLKFPDDLDGTQYMIIDILQRNRQARRSNVERKTVKSIILPLPGNLVHSHSLNYQNENLGIAGGAMAGMVTGQDLLNAGSAAIDAAGNVLGDLVEAIGTGNTTSIEKYKEIATGGALAGGATAVAARAGGTVAGLLAAGGLGSGVAGGLSVATGMAINPHMAVVFQGSNFREHQFTYKFIARNQSESDTLKRIIKRFESYMLPSYAGQGLLLEYPNEFRIRFSKALEGTLYRIGDCVLKSMSVNYNGEGFPIFFETTNEPVSIEIQLNFQETKIVTRETVHRRDY